MMEILQTIWTALTTPNKELLNILILPLHFIEAYISMLLFTTILNINATKKQKFIYVLSMSFVSIFSRLVIPNPFNTFFNVLSIFLLNIFIFKISIFKGILALIIPFITTAILESIFAKIYDSIFKIDYIQATIVPIHRLLISLIIYFMQFIIYLFLKYYKLNFSKFEILNSKKKYLLIANTILGLILIGSQIYIVYFYASVLPFYIILLNLISLITYILFNLYTIFTVSKLETTSTNLEEAQLYNKTLEILQDNTRAFRHDFANILQGMVGYMDKNDMEGLKKYYSQLVDDIQHSNNLTTLSPKVVNNPAIYNVLANKYHKADGLGIKIHLEAFLDMNELDMKIYEFTRVLGILMDNAIEAASECEDKIINVTFRKDTRKHIQLLIVENTYKDKEINTDKIFEKGFSTKEGNTGLGLWEIRQILKKNTNLNLFTTKNSEFFTQQFEIYYTNTKTR